MSNETAKTFPWWGYLEFYIYGVLGVFVAAAWLDINKNAFGEVLLRPFLMLTVPALGIYGLEHTRRALARSFLGEREFPERELPERDPDADARARITNKRGIFTYALGRAQYIPFEEALGAFIPIRILLSLFVMMGVPTLFICFGWLIYATGMITDPNPNPNRPMLLLLVVLGFSALFTFVTNLALAYAWRGGVRATTHLMEGRRALVARREAIEASQMGGALSTGMAADGSGELSMSRAGELTEHVVTSARDEGVALDLDEMEEREPSQVAVVASVGEE